jgi:rhamnosyltransferase
VEQKKVAVLVATYNGAKWLRDQFTSIANQRDVDISMFVSDDCSVDNTIALIRELGIDSRLTILPIGEKFGSASANFFRLFRDVEFEQFDYVFLADQDDVWHTDKVIAGIRQMAGQHADCYASDLICTYETGARVLLKKSFPQTRNDFLFQGASAGCTYGLTARAAQAVQRMVRGRENKWFVSSSHDWIIYAVTRSLGFSWFIDNHAYIDYRQHPNNAWGALGLKSYIKRWKLLRNGWYRNNILAVGELCQLDGEHHAILARLKRWNFLDRISLSLKSFSFRRSPTEKLATGLMILLGVF